MTLRILYVSFRFAPFNTIGAVRSTKQVQHLLDFGCDVRVIMARRQHYDASLPSLIDPSRVTATRWFDVNVPVRVALGGNQVVAQRGYEPPGRSDRTKRILRTAGGMYRALINFPDGEVGWYPFAVRAMRRLMGSWRPDVILASGMPWTGLVAAARVAKTSDVPFVSEFRDLWVDSHSRSTSRLLAPVANSLEQFVLDTSKRVITVSAPLAEELSRRAGKPVDVVMNGFDSEIALEETGALDAHKDGPQRSEVLTLVYTGMIYPGQRDPGPLFAAIRLLGAMRSRLRVIFLGRNAGGARDIARAHGVLEQVEFRGQVAYAESLRWQRRADVLLLLLWSDLAQDGIYTGKLFEYLGARRPILAIGRTDDAAAELVTSTKSGWALDEPRAIASRLSALIEAKRTESLNDLDLESVARFSRRAQCERLFSILREARDA